MKYKLIFLILFFLLCIFTWQGVYLPKNPLGQEEIFSVEKGQGFLEISRNLEGEELIKNRFYFNLYLFLTGNYKKLKAGKYLLFSSMTISEITEKIISGDVVKIKLTIPEGFTLEQIEERLIENELIVSREIKNKKAKIYKDEFEFLKNLPDEANLEGFLFPDTYYFPYDVSLDEILRKMLENFDEKLAPYRNEVAGSRFSIFEIVTMASIIEKEVRTLEDKKLVSGILWKRLKNNIPLQVDCTITYITGRKTVKVSLEDLKIDSPYNTYKYKGLPIAPICNPGLESILTSLYPKESTFWYYLSTPEGETVFSKTLEEHRIAKEQYLKNTPN